MKTALAALLIAASPLALSAQERLAPARTASAPRNIRLEGYTNGTDFTALTAFFEDGSTVPNWTVPAGKVLQVTDASLHLYMNQNLSSDLGVSLDQSYPSGSILSLLGGVMPAPRQNQAFTASFTTGWTFTAATPLSLHVDLNYTVTPSVQAAQVQLSGVLRSAN